MNIPSLTSGSVLSATAKVLAILTLLLQTGIAPASEITALVANGFRPILDELGPAFEKSTGHKLAVSYATVGAVVKRVQSGEIADVVITPRQGVDGLVKSSHAAAANVAVIARSHIGVAVRKGLAKPDISSPDALKRALLAAKAVSYSDPAEGGASGVVIERAFERLGIRAEIKAKTLLAANTSAMVTLAANGKADLFLNQYQNLLAIPSAEIIGTMPGDLAEVTIFASAILASAKNADAARALVAFLRGADAAKLLKAKGMEPG